ncbi:MAG: hypothetical protein LBU46_00740 [Candidatus Accumulibacter sp.]|jgi:hypothetical protein|nr:hypothetical protein [Accumulibacter sp.]
MGWPEIEQLRQLLADGIRLCACSPVGAPPPRTHSCQSRQIKITIPFDRRIVLDEPAPEATLKRVYINGVSSDGLALKLDVCGIHFWAAKKLGKICDFVILTEQDNKKYAIFIDLKSSLPRKPCEDTTLPIIDKDDLERVWQFNGGSLLFDYMSLGVAFHGGSNGLLTDYEKCFFELYAIARPPTTGTVLPTVPNGKIAAGIKKLRHKYILTQQVGNAAELSVNSLIATWIAFKEQYPTARRSVPIQF